MTEPTGLTLKRTEIEGAFRRINGIAFGSGDPAFLRDAALKALDSAEEIKRLRDALTKMYDKWENGTPCHEFCEGDDSVENTGISVGNAFKLSTEEEDEILALIPESAALAPKEKEK